MTRRLKGSKAPTIYIRRQRSDTWHWQRSCSNYPKVLGRTVTRDSKPTSGEFCDQCQAKEKRANG